MRYYQKHLLIMIAVSILLFTMLACNLVRLLSPAATPALPAETKQTPSLPPQLPQPGAAPTSLALPLPSIPAARKFPDECPSYPPDFQFVEVPDPLSGQNLTYPLIPRVEPAVGECFTDQHFGPVLRRVTRTDGYNSRHEYSRIDPLNADQSMVLLVTEQGTYMVYRTQSVPYNQEGNLLMEVSLAEPRWDPVDPNLLWALQDYTIVNVNVVTQEITMVKDFTQDERISPLIAQGTPYRVTMMDEGETSNDKRFWAFSLQGNEKVDYRHQYFFTWDREKDEVLGVYPDGEPIPSDQAEIDWIGMSSLGNWVLIGGMSGNQGNLAGLTMTTKNFSQFYRLDYTTSHADVGLDANGKEVVVMQNSNTDFIDLIPLDPSTKPIMEAGGSYQGTGHIPLMRLFYSSDSPDGLNSGVHISCNAPGYCFISTTIPKGATEQNWLDRSLVLARLDRNHPRVFYLAKLYNTISEEPRVYWDETHGSITNDGSMLVWAENWGNHVGEAQIFMMQLIMPSNWRGLTGQP